MWSCVRPRQYYTYVIINMLLSHLCYDGTYVISSRISHVTCMPPRWRPPDSHMLLLYASIYMLLSHLLYVIITCYYMLLSITYNNNI